MRLAETAPLSLVVRLEPARADRAVCARARPADEDLGLISDAAVLLVNLWCEAPDVIRGSISHPKSGSIAMVQGNGALRKLAEEVQLRLKKS